MAMCRQVRIHLYSNSHRLKPNHSISRFSSTDSPSAPPCHATYKNPSLHHTNTSRYHKDGEPIPRYQLPPSPRTAWREKKQVELAEGSPHETTTEREERLEELQWIRDGMTQVDYNTQKAYRKAEKLGVGKPSRQCHEGGLSHGDAGWSVIEDGTPGRKMM